MDDCSCPSEMLVEIGSISKKTAQFFTYTLFLAIYLHICCGDPGQPTCGVYQAAPLLNPLHIGVEGKLSPQNKIGMRNTRKENDMWLRRVVSDLLADHPASPQRTRSTVHEEEPSTVPFYTPIMPDFPMDYYGESTRGDLIPSMEYQQAGLELEPVKTKEAADIFSALGLERLGWTAAPFSPVPAHRAVFCSRTLNFRSIRVVGYDMDYTLVPNPAAHPIPMCHGSALLRNRGLWWATAAGIGWLRALEPRSFPISCLLSPLSVFSVSTLSVCCTCPQTPQPASFSPAPVPSLPLPRLSARLAQFLFHAFSLVPKTPLLRPCSLAPLPPPGGALQVHYKVVEWEGRAYHYAKQYLSQVAHRAATYGG